MEGLFELLSAPGNPAAFHIERESEHCGRGAPYHGPVVRPHCVEAPVVYRSRNLGRRVGAERDGVLRRGAEVAPQDIELQGEREAPDGAPELHFATVITAAPEIENFEGDYIGECIGVVEGEIQQGALAAAPTVQIYDFGGIDLTRLAVKGGHGPYLAGGAAE